MRWKDSNQDEIIKVNKGLRDHDVTFEHLLCLSHLATVVLIHDHGDSPLSFFFHLLSLISSMIPDTW